MLHNCFGCRIAIAVLLFATGGWSRGRAPRQMRVAGGAEAVPKDKCGCRTLRFSGCGF